MATKKTYKKRTNTVIAIDDVYGDDKYFRTKWYRTDKPRPPVLGMWANTILDILEEERVKEWGGKIKLFECKALFSKYIERLQLAFPTNQHILKTVNFNVTKLCLDGLLARVTRDKYANRLYQKPYGGPGIKKRRLDEIAAQAEAKVNYIKHVEEEKVKKYSPMYLDLIKLPMNKGILIDDVMNVQAYQITKNQMTIICPYCRYKSGFEFGEPIPHHHSVPEKVELGYCQTGKLPHCGSSFPNGVDKNFLFNVHITEKTIITDTPLLPMKSIITPKPIEIKPVSVPPKPIVKSMPVPPKPIVIKPKVVTFTYDKSQWCNICNRKSEQCKCYCDNCHKMARIQKNIERFNTSDLCHCD